MFKHTLSLVASATLVASLGAKDLSLEPIVVSASKTEQSLKNITSNVEIITAEEIEEKHYTTLGEALRSLPGISVVSNGGLGSTQSVFLRGMDTNRVLVLINGIRYQDPSNTSGAGYAHLMISDIERIEVIKGAQSGIWGADASAGVVNIVTKKAEKGSHAGIHLERGSFNTKKWGGYVSHRTDRYDIKLAMDRIMSESFTTQAPEGNDIDGYEKDPYANTTLNVDARLRATATDTLSVHYTDINALSHYDGYNAPDSVQRSDIRTKLYGAGYDKIAGNHLLSFKVNRSDFTRDELDTAFGVKGFEGRNEQAEISDRIDYRQNDLLVAGGSYESYEVDILQANGQAGNMEMRNKGVFATNTNHVGSLILSESVRRDTYSNFRGKTTGKIGAKYALNADLFLSGNYGNAYTAPNLIQILNPWGTSNLDLKPENSRSFDLSAGYRNFSVTYFDNRVEDLIQWSGGKYQNLDGTSTFTGYELSVQHSVRDTLSFHANYTHLSRFEDKNGKDLARRAKREIKGGIDYYGIDGFHVGLDAHYVGTRFDQADQQGAQTGRYTIFNAVVNYAFSPNLSFYGKIDNLTDKYYQSVDGYATSPRAWYVGMKASF